MAVTDIDLSEERHGQRMSDGCIRMLVTCVRCGRDVHVIHPPNAEPVEPWTCFRCRR